MRLTKEERAILERLEAGWVPLRAQIASGTRMMNRGLLRLDWGPQDTPDADKMVWYVTEKARKELAKP